MGFGNSFNGGVSSSGAIADGSITEAKLADGAVTDSKIAAAFKQTLFNQNLFKNPAFSVIQGTASGTLANSLALPTASLGYLGETEWGIAASGGTPAYAFSSANESITFTGAASTTAIYLLQRLESRDTNRIKSKTVTFSVELSNSLLTSVTWEVFRPTTTADVHGTIASPTQTLIASGTWTVSSTLTRHSATFTLPAEASLGLEIRLRVGAQTSGTWVISRPQLEEGGVTTDFNCGDYTEELRKCRRYFRDNTWRQTTTATAASQFFSINFPVNDMFAPASVVNSGVELENVNATNIAWATTSQFAYRSVSAGDTVYSAQSFQASHIP